MILFLRKYSNMKIVLGLFLLALSSIKGDFPDECLLNDLFKNYNKHARPLQSGDDILEIKMNLNLLRIVNYEHSVLTLDIWRFMSWHDARLSWDPSWYSNITETIIYPPHLWMPDVLLYNSYHDEMIHHSYPLLLHNNGEVYYIPHERLAIHCNHPIIDATSGEVTCTLTFGSWTQSENHLRLNDTLGSINDIEYVEGNHWHYVKSSVEVVSKKYDCCPEHYATTNYKITFKHKYHDC